MASRHMGKFKSFIIVVGRRWHPPRSERVITLPRNVRFGSKADMESDIAGRQLRANFGLMRRSNQHPFLTLVGAGE